MTNPDIDPVPSEVGEAKLITPYPHTTPYGSQIFSQYHLKRVGGGTFGLKTPRQSSEAIVPKFRTANLAEANLHGADLKQANLTGADLKEANLSDADLSGARRPTVTPALKALRENDHLRRRPDGTWLLPNPKAGCLSLEDRIDELKISARPEAITPAHSAQALAGPVTAASRS